MNIKKRENIFWKLKFGLISPSLAPVEIKKLAWKDQNATDEDLEYLCSKIKFITQMDLDNNLITNKGIEYLTLLDGIKELRLKGLNIDDNSLDSLQRLRGVTLLHLGGTNLSSTAIGRLSCLRTLKTLICTPDPMDPIPLRMFKESLPNCELIVNYKEFER